MSIGKYTGLNINEVFKEQKLFFGKNDLNKSAFFLTSRDDYNYQLLNTIHPLEHIAKFIEMENPIERPLYYMSAELCDTEDLAMNEVYDCSLAILWVDTATETIIEKPSWLNDL